MKAFVIIGALFAFATGTVATATMASAGSKPCTYTTADKKKGYKC